MFCKAYVWIRPSFAFIVSTLPSLECRLLLCKPLGRSKDWSVYKAKGKSSINAKIFRIGPENASMEGSSSVWRSCTTSECVVFINQYVAGRREPITWHCRPSHQDHTTSKPGRHTNQDHFNIALMVTVQQITIEHTKRHYGGVRSCSVMYIVSSYHTCISTAALSARASFPYKTSCKSAGPTVMELPDTFIQSVARSQSVHDQTFGSWTWKIAVR